MSLKERLGKEIDIQKSSFSGIKRPFDPLVLAIGIISPITAVLVGLFITAILLWASGKDASFVFGEIFRSAFVENFSETVVKAIPLALTGLAVAIAFRVRLWNIGAEGQFYAGVLAATALALGFPTLPAWVIIPAMLLAGMLGGALWALLPAILRAWLEVNEIISSLMLNYVAVLLADYFIFGPWRDPKGFNFPVTATFSDSARLPIIVEGTRIHFGLILALVVATLLWLLGRTRWGFELKVMGDNLNTARYAGIKVTRNIIFAFLLSGAVAGLAGMSEVTGVAGRLQQGISPGYGYTAIIVAWLARLNSWSILLVAVLFGGLLASGFTMQRIGVPSGLVTMLQGIILFCVLAGESLSRRLLYLRALRRNNEKKGQE
ncbi:ABC transporter permease [Candidatus Chlorohelix allophototropha]|uniref:ABC transporter permease n=1 Tax=Candidatus Chlorohelix allophototropha TaxID=3003348 RepID=A0ABY9B4W9_9CHLR|nr:ABC transporter permease [Chloroflexota bacterium L227-S17]